MDETTCCLATCTVRVRVRVRFKVVTVVESMILTGEGEELVGC